VNLKEYLETHVSVLYIDDMAVFIVEDELHAVQVSQARKRLGIDGKDAVMSIRVMERRHATEAIHSAENRAR
jgi:hypothetical protein